MEAPACYACRAYFDLAASWHFCRRRVIPLARWNRLITTLDVRVYIVLGEIEFIM